MERSLHAQAEQVRAIAVERLGPRSVGVLTAERPEIKELEGQILG